MFYFQVKEIVGANIENYNQSMTQATKIFQKFLNRRGSQDEISGISVFLLFFFFINSIFIIRLLNLYVLIGHISLK